MKDNFFFLEESSNASTNSADEALLANNTDIKLQTDKGTTDNVYRKNANSHIEYNKHKKKDFKSAVKFSTGQNKTDVQKPSDSNIDSFIENHNGDVLFVDQNANLLDSKINQEAGTSMMGVTQRADTLDSKIFQEAGSSVMGVILHADTLNSKINQESGDSDLYIKQNSNSSINNYVNQFSGKNTVNIEQQANSVDTKLQQAGGKNAVSVNQKTDENNIHSSKEKTIDIDELNISQEGGRNSVDIKNASADSIIINQTGAFNTIIINKTDSNNPLYITINQTGKSNETAINNEDNNIRSKIQKEKVEQLEQVVVYNDDTDVTVKNSIINFEKGDLKRDTSDRIAGLNVINSYVEKGDISQFIRSSSKNVVAKDITIQGCATSGSAQVVIANETTKVTDPKAAAGEFMKNLGVTLHIVDAINTPNLKQKKLSQAEAVEIVKEKFDLGDITDIVITEPDMPNKGKRKVDLYSNIQEQKDKRYKKNDDDDKGSGSMSGGPGIDPTGSGDSSSSAGPSNFKTIFENTSIILINIIATGLDAINEIKIFF